MKKLLFGLVAFLFLGVQPALAAEVINEETGAGSKNEAGMFVSVVERVVNQNTVSQQNSVTAVAETGSNSASFNTGNIEDGAPEQSNETGGGASSIRTGEAAFEVVIDNKLNSNVTGVEGCCGNNDDNGQGGGDDNNGGGLEPVGEEPTIIADNPIEPAGFGGGELLSLNNNFDGSTLPATGADALGSFGILFGLPSILAMLISIAEEKKRARIMS